MSGETKSQWRRRARVLALVGLLAAAGTGAWLLWPERVVPLEPPVPEGIQESEIVNYFSLQREKILANPASADAWGKYGMALLAHLFDREADRCFAEAVRLDPGNPEWAYARAQIALKRDQAAAPEQLRRVIATTGRGEEFRAVARLTLAETLYENGDVPGAETLFRAALGPAPGEPRAAFGLGLIASAAGDREAARRHLSAVLNSPNARKQARVNLARVAQSSGDEALARRLEAEAARLPDDLAWPDPFLDEVARLAVGRRGRERAIDELERAGQFGEALQLYLRDLDDARTPKVLLGAGANYLRLREYDRAMEVIQEAVALDPNSSHAQYTLALAYFIPAERQIHDDPRSERAIKAFREVVTHAKRATELKPNHARAYLHWGAALLHLGSPREAIEPLKKGVLVRPEDFDIQFTLGQAFARVGDVAEARKHFRNAQGLEPNNPQPARELEKLDGKK